jgi:hypothetical protein
MHEPKLSGGSFQIGSRAFVGVSTIVVVLAASFALAANIIGDWSGTLRVPNVSL